jgi:hypothetical protein
VRHWQYQRSRQEAEDILKKEEAERRGFYENVLFQEVSADIAANYSDLFQNPFARGTLKDNEKPVK